VRTNLNAGLIAMLGRSTTYKMIDSLKLCLKGNYLLFKVLRLPLIITGSFRRKRNAVVDDFWKTRIDIVGDAPDNDFISRVKNAGEIKNDVQIMHNGLKIHVGSYYGDGNTVLLYRNKGVHEPQEERAFNEVLKLLPQNAVMLELGAFWSFYSMTFQLKIKKGLNFLIEPDPHALLSGKHNFRLNNLNGNFFNYFVSDENIPGKISTVTVDRFLSDNRIQHLTVLHSDIQGFELKMLWGAERSLRQGKIDYLFISTHSNELHAACLEFLKNLEYKIMCEADLDATYSWDGLIVARRKNLQAPESFQISKRK